MGSGDQIASGRAEARMFWYTLSSPSVPKREKRAVPACDLPLRKSAKKFYGRTEWPAESLNDGDETAARTGPNVVAIAPKKWLKVGSSALVSTPRHDTIEVWCSHRQVEQPQGKWAAPPS